MIGWAFMGSVCCLISVYIFLKSEQLIYKSSLDNSVLNTSIARGAVHTQTATQNVISTFAGGWGFKFDVFAWQFGTKLILMQQANRAHTSNSPTSRY